MSFFRFVTIHACDGRMDGQTDGWTVRILIAIPRLHYMQHSKKQLFANEIFKYIHEVLTVTWHINAYKNVTSLSK